MVGKIYGGNETAYDEGTRRPTRSIPTGGVCTTGTSNPSKRANRGEKPKASTGVVQIFVSRRRTRPRGARVSEKVYDALLRVLYHRVRGDAVNV